MATDGETDPSENPFVPLFFRQTSPMAPNFPPFRMVLFRPQTGELESLTENLWYEDRERLPKEVELILREHAGLVDPGEEVSNGER